MISESSDPPGPVAIVRADLRCQAHAQALVTLLDGYARDPMGGGEPLSAYARAHLAETLAARPGTHVLLAYAGAQPVGLLNAFEGFSTFACRPLLAVHDIAVAPGWRGQGIGQRLLAEAEAVAREIGACKLTLEVLDGNAPAQAAYRKAGFAPYVLDPALGRAQFWQKPLK